METLIQIFKEYKLMRPIAALSEHWIPKSILAALAAIFSTPAEFIMGLMVLIIVDFVTGIAASLKKGEKLSSIKMMHTGVKIIVFTAFLFTASILSFFINYTFHFGAHWFESFCVLLMALTEFISIGQHLASIYPPFNHLFQAAENEIQSKTHIDLTNNSNSKSQSS